MTKVIEIVELSSSSEDDDSNSDDDYKDASSICLLSSSSESISVVNIPTFEAKKEKESPASKGSTSSTFSPVLKKEKLTDLSVYDDLSEGLSKINIKDKTNDEYLDDFSDDDADLLEPVSFLSSVKKNDNKVQAKGPQEKLSSTVAKYILTFEEEIGISEFTSNPFKGKKFDSIEDDQDFTGDYDEAQRKIQSMQSIIDPQLDVLDPNPDIAKLYADFDERFFDGFMASHPIKLGWANNMTRTAGMFYSNRKRTGPAIRLSACLLKLLPRKEMVETLLHEMIHAYLFFSKCPKGTGHNGVFKAHMRRINEQAGTNVTVYHSFHAEVRLLKKYQWQCSGEKCRRTYPYRGYISLPTRRKPNRFDYCFRLHESMACEGQFQQLSDNFEDKPSKDKAGGQQEQEVQFIDEDDEELDEEEYTITIRWNYEWKKLLR